MTQVVQITTCLLVYLKHLKHLGASYFCNKCTLTLLATSLRSRVMVFEGVSLVGKCWRAWDICNSLTQQPSHTVHEFSMTKSEHFHGCCFFLNHILYSNQQPGLHLLKPQSISMTVWEKMDFILLNYCKIMQNSYVIQGITVPRGSWSIACGSGLPDWTLLKL